MKAPKKHEKTLSNLEKGLLVVAALMLIGGTFWLKSLLGTYKVIIDRLPDHSEEPRTYSAENIQNPVRVLLRSDDEKTAIYQEARDKKAEIENDFIKDKRGLNAQEGMWYAATELLRFTAYQLFFLVITTIASFAGLYFIIQTLKATQEANLNTIKAIDETSRANDIAEKSSRLVNMSYMEFHSAEVKWEPTGISNSPDSYTVEVNLGIKNTGNTSAFKVSDFKIESFVHMVRTILKETDADDKVVSSDILVLDESRSDKRRAVGPFSKPINLIYDDFPLIPDSIQPKQIGSFSFHCIVSAGGEAANASIAENIIKAKEEGLAIAHSYAAQVSFECRDAFNHETPREFTVVFSDIDTGIPTGSIKEHDRDK